MKEYPRKIHLNERVFAHVSWRQIPVPINPWKMPRKPALTIWEVPNQITKEDAQYLYKECYSKSWTFPEGQEIDFNVLFNRVGDAWAIVIASAYFPPSEVLRCLLRVSKDGIEYLERLNEHIPSFAFFVDRLVSPMTPEERTTFLAEAAVVFDEFTPPFDAPHKEAFLSFVEGGARLEAYLTERRKTFPNWVPVHALIRLQNEETCLKFKPMIDTWRLRSEQLQYWVAATEWRHLDVFQRFRYNPFERFQRDPARRNDPETLFEIVEAPEMAEQVVWFRVQEDEINSNKREIRDLCRADGLLAWFRKYPVCGGIGLVRMIDRKHALAAYSFRYLHDLIAEKAIDPESLKPFLSEGEKSCLDDLLEYFTRIEKAPAELPESLAKLLEKPPKVKPVKGFDAAKLWPLTIGRRPLQLGDTVRLLAHLQGTKLEKTSPVFSEIKRVCDASSIDRFLFSLCSHWIDLDAPTVEKWMITAHGHLGGDSTIPQIREWIKLWDSITHRAVDLLKCLQKIGTSPAIKALKELDSKVESKALRQIIKKMYSECADKAVSKCGLDERGGWDIDYGPRQFRMQLDSNCKPVIKHHGKILTSLPNPVASDDPAKVAAAKTGWAQITKEIKENAKLQSETFEQNMVNGVRWSIAEFQELCTNQLFLLFGRMVVFGVMDDRDQVITTFRIREGLEFADVHDEPYALPKKGKIGVVHPTMLSDELIRSWGVLHGEYMIIPTFKQLTRKCARVTEQEKKETAVVRYRDVLLDSYRIEGILKSTKFLLFHRNDVRFVKYYPAYKVTAVIQMPPGDGEEYSFEGDGIEAIQFVQGKVAAGKAMGEPELPAPMKLEDVHPALFSEVMRIPEAMRLKEKD